MASGDVAALMLHGGMTWQELFETPPRVLRVLLDALGQRGAFRKKPPASPLDRVMTPQEFAAFWEARGHE